MSQGGTANLQGRKFERNLEAQIEAHGLTFTRKPKIVGGALWDDGDITPDILIHETPNYPLGLYIEAKWQDSSGSAFEKIPYVVTCIKECYDRPGILVMGGDKLTRCFAWCAQQVDTKFLGAMNEQDFTRWLMRNGF